MVCLGLWEGTVAVGFLATLLFGVRGCKASMAHRVCHLSPLTEG